MRRVLVQLALVAATRAALAQDSTATPHLPAGLTVPARILHYARSAAKDFGSPEGGVAYQYGDSVTRLTVYLYARDSTWRGRPAREALQQEVQLFKQALEIERTRGAYEAYQIAFDEPDSIPLVTAGSAFAPGRQVAVALRRQRTIYVSLYYVYAIGNAFVKVRGTVPQARWQQTDIPLFAREFARQASGGAPRP